LLPFFADAIKTKYQKKKTVAYKFQACDKMKSPCDIPNCLLMFSFIRVLLSVLADAIKTKYQKKKNCGRKSENQMYNILLPCKTSRQTI
jgi:hypothetical protein